MATTGSPIPYAELVECYFLVLLIPRGSVWGQALYRNLQFGEEARRARQMGRYLYPFVHSSKH